MLSLLTLFIYRLIFSLCFQCLEVEGSLLRSNHPALGVSNGRPGKKLFFIFSQKINSLREVEVP